MKTLLSLFSLQLLLAGFTGAQQVPEAEAKLREALRTMALQLRTAQTENAELQAYKTRSEAEIAGLTARVETLTKQANEEQQSSKKTIGELTQRNEQLATAGARLEEALQKWKAAYHKAAEFARQKETERAKLADEKTVLQAKVRDHKAQNLELFRTASEILTRYEEFSLGKALKAREPFTGIARSRLEMQVQEYRDKVEDQRLRPERP